jgi:hypothetical protein
LTSVLGRQIAHHNLTIKELSERHQSQGLPAVYADMLAGLDGLIAKGAEERTNDIIQSLTGKSPTKLQDFLEPNKAVWEAAKSRVSGSE